MQRRSPVWLAPVVVALALVVAYWPSLGGGFIWDDDAHIVDDPQLRDLGGLVRIWLPGNTPQFYPLTFSLFWLEYQLWGAAPLGYDLVNLALHALNALLVWRLGRELGVPGAGVIAAVFALHPLHVETVAWAMETKNVLSGAFYLAAAICYLRFDREREAAFAHGEATPSWGGWVAALGLFGGALLSKSVTSTLPAALVLALLWRESGRPAAVWSVRRLAPLAPFFALGIALALQTAWLERDFVGARGGEFAFTPAERALIASRALLFYAQKLLVPEPLSFCHPRWEIAGAPLSAYWPVAVVAAIAVAAALAFARGRRGVPLALAFYAGSLFPALGFIDFYPMVYSFVADHFAYLPSLGVIAAAVGCGGALLRTPAQKRAGALLALAALGALTARQSAHFADALTLYRHAIAQNPSGYLCVALAGTELTRRGQAELAEGRAADARASFREAQRFSAQALALKEDQSATHLDLAVAHFALGEAAPGLLHAERAAQLAPRNPDALLLAARALEVAGRRVEAARRYERAAALGPPQALAHVRLAELYRRERPREALAHARRALALASNESEQRDATVQLAWLLATSADDTIRDAPEALRLARSIPQPGLRARRAEAAALAALGRGAEARRLCDALGAHARAAGQLTFAELLARDAELYARGEMLRE